MKNPDVTRSLPIPVQRRPFHPINTKYSNEVSPLSSPSSSPFCSPSHSPVPNRKTVTAASSVALGSSTSTKDITDTYTSTTNWLKSIRLHKYSELLQNYSFQKVSFRFKIVGFCIYYINCYILYTLRNKNVDFTLIDDVSSIIENVEKFINGHNEIKM